MYAGIKRAAAVVLVVGSLIGCEDDRAADKKVRATIAEARMEAAAGTPEASRKAIQLLSTAASTEGASDGMLAIAKAAHAQAELEQANRLIIDIERKEIELRRVAFEILQLAVQIRASGSSASGYRQFNPNPAREQIAAKIAEAQGGAGKAAWFTHGDSTIPTLSAVKQDISRLEGEISQLQEQIKNVTAQRTALIDDAEKAAAESEQRKGREAVDIFKKASDLRKQASEKSIELDGLNGKLARLERDLAVSKGQETNLNDVIAQLQAQSAALDAAWKEIDTHIARQKQLATEILGTASGGAPSEADPLTRTSKPIADKAVELDALVKEIAKLREETAPVLDGAIKHFADAYNKATACANMYQGLLIDPKNQNRPERSAWEAAKEVIAPLQYKFQQAGAQRVLGTFYASQVNSVSNLISLRNTVNEAFKLAELKVPPAIDDAELPKKLQTATDLADSAYKESEEILTNIIDGQATESLRHNARLSRAITFVERSLIERMMNKTAEADAHVTAAKADRDAAAEAGLQIPAMPPELGPPPVKAVPVPATEPTPTVSPEETAARAALVAFADAVDKGDVEALKPLSQIEAGQDQLFEGAAKLAINSTKLHKALKTKFGEKADEVLKDMPNFSKLLREAKITIKDDNLFIEGLAEPGQKKGDFVKVEGQWKFLIDTPETDEDKKAAEMIPKLAEAMGTLATDVEGGKYSSVEEFMTGLQQAMGGLQ
jgi:hypothetical protein